MQSSTFQLIDIDQHTNAVDMTCIRMFGRDSEGSGIIVEVHGFETYFYMNKPHNLTCDQVMDRMNNQLQRRRRIMDGVSSVKIVRKQSVLYYSSTLQDMLCVTVSRPSVMQPLRMLIEKDRLFAGIDRTYESNVSYIMRFMVDFHINGACWIRVRGSSASTHTTKTIHVQLQQSDHQVEAMSPESSEWQHIAPVYILSFDIECAGRRGIFPTPTMDPVIQIGCVLHRHQQSSESIVLCLHETDPIPGVDVRCFATETELLQAFADLVCAFDPDILIGYNIINFDLPYLLERAETLKIHSFACLGRITGERTVVKNSVFQSRQSGARESKEIQIQGRFILDLFVVMQRSYKLRSYSLNSVCSHFLAEQKEDVHYSEITGLFETDSTTRNRLAVYCLKDAMLPLQLMNKLMILYNYVEMSRVTGVPMNYLLTRGQQIKVMSQIYRHARKHDIVVPANQPQPQANPSNQSNKREREDSDADSDQEVDGYEGAIVLDPIIGFHQRPIATLDFQSLYPSIMIAHNLCYTTYIPPAFRSQVDPEIVTWSPDKNHTFVKASTRLGLLPEILVHLLQARDRAKKEMKKTNDPMTKAVLDGRQVALKVSANSVYGFTGASIGLLPLVQIASTVTSFGREMIMSVKQTIELSYPGTRVIYGDTDSVMIDFAQAHNVQESMDLAREASVLVSSKFIKPINMVFEKVCPTILYTHAHDNVARSYSFCLEWSFSHCGFCTRIDCQTTASLTHKSTKSLYSHCRKLSVRWLQARNVCHLCFVSIWSFTANTDPSIHWCCAWCNW